MDTQFESTLNPEAFEPPFDEIVADFVEKGRVLHGSLIEHMRPEWQHRSLEILIVDDASLNACATHHSGCDRIYIFRGSLEHIYGTILGLLSTPTFFPTIGDVNNEVRPENLPAGRFPPVPLLKNVSDADRNTRLFFPNDQTRMTLAQVLAELALEFLIYHEIGHIVGGHLEIPRNGDHVATITEFQQKAKPDDATFQHLLECDADAFACHVTSSVHSHDQMAAMLRDLLSAALQPKDFALQTYLMSIGVLFRALYAIAPRTLDTYKSSHPHPAVRACLVASSTMARGLSDGTFASTSPLNSVVANSVGNIEDVWADLSLSGQNPQASVDWAQSVRDAAMALFESYGNSRTLFEQYARLPRRWDDWAWPETQKSA